MLPSLGCFLGLLSSGLRSDTPDPLTNCVLQLLSVGFRVNIPRPPPALQEGCLLEWLSLVSTVSPPKGCFQSISRLQSKHPPKPHFPELPSTGSRVNAPESRAEALGQLGHDGMALILDGAEGGQVAVVAEHSTGAGVAAQGPRRL